MMMLRSRLLKGNAKHFRGVGSSMRAMSAQKGYVLDGTVPKGPDYNANAANMKGLVENFDHMIQKIHQGGGERAQEKLKARNKLFVRDRINTLVDSGSPFLEVGALAGHEMYGKDWLPAAGLVTGVGTVHG